MKNTLRLIVFIIFLVTSFTAFSQGKMSTKKWRKSERDSMEHAQLFFDEGNKMMALPIFEKLLEQHPGESYLKYISAVCGLDRSDWHERSLKYIQEVYAKNKKVHNIQFQLARALHFNYKFDEAIATLNEFEAKNKNIEPEVKKMIPLLRNYCDNGKKMTATPRAANITNIGTAINTAASEYVPVLNADETVMIFTYRGEKSMGGRQNAYNEDDPYGIFYEDIFITKKENGQWTEPKSIPAVNTRENDGAICLSHDGLTLFIFRDDRSNGGDILVSHFQNGEWTTPDQLYGDVNTRAWEGSVTLSPDEKTIIFASERPGGYGGKDLYISALQEDGTWGTAKNLGDKVNTPYDDDAPFFHPDGKTLLFSSRGNASMGGFDIFRAGVNADSVWVISENLGYPINTTDDDIYYVLSTDGKRGYYASGKLGGQGLQDIYLVEPGLAGFTPNVCLLKGTITREKTVAEADIDITVASTGKKYYPLKSHPETGKYIVTLPAGEEYTVKYKLNGFPDQVKMVSMLNQTGYSEQVIDIDFSKKVDSVPVVVNTPKKDSVKAVPTNTVTAETNVIADVTGTMTKEGLIFKVQIAAYKTPKNYSYKHLNGMGKVEKMVLEDGITRFTIGGEFKTLEEAGAHCSKVRGAGQQDAFVTAIYDGKRAYIEDLQQKGIIPKN